MDPILVITLLFIIIFFGIFLLSYEIYRAGKKGDEVKELLNTRIFLVSLPKEPMVKEGIDKEPLKDFRQIISVAEQMFAAFSSLYSHNLQNRLLRKQEKISFEIVAHEGLISFYVSCPKMIEEMVEKQINAYYPNAHLEKVSQPNIFALPGGKGEFAAGSLKLNKKFVLPIRTYQTLESEPLSAVTNAMSKLGENASAAVQLIIKPAGEEWKTAVQMSVKKVQEGKSAMSNEGIGLKILNGFFNGLSNVFSGAANPQQAQAEMENKAKMQQNIQLNPIQEALLKSLNDKASKQAFSANVRIVATGADKTSAEANLQTIASAFSQFGTPELNSFRVSHGDANMVKEYILRRFIGKGLLLNTEELASIFHFPNQNVETPNIKWLLAKEMAPPANAPQQGVILGKSVYRGVETPIRIQNEDRRRHIFMIGKTGVGKTTLFANMFEQDMLSGAGCCFIDPLGDAIEDLLGKVPPERQKDVVLFDPSDTQHPLGLNLLEFKTPEQRDFLIQESIQIFYKLFDPGQTGIVGPQWEHWFRNAALTVMSQPGGGTLIVVPRLFTDDAFRNQMVSYVQDPLVKNFWTQQLAKTADFHKSEMYNYFISKFGRFMTNDLMRNIIGQKKSSFDLRELMDSGKILLVNLSKGKIGEVNSSLLGMIIVSKIQMAAFSRADIAEDTRRDFYLYVDEFQNFTTDSFATILSEARKYHLNLNITNQYIAQLKENIRDAVIGNAGTLICYRIGAADAEFMIKEFPGITVSDMTNLDKFNTYVKLLIDGTPSKPFSMKGIKSPMVSSAETREQTRNLSRQNFGRPQEEVQSEMMQNFKVQETPPTGTNEPLRNL